MTRYAPSGPGSSGPDAPDHVPWIVISDLRIGRGRWRGRSPLGGPSAERLGCGKVAVPPSTAQVPGWRRLLAFACPGYFVAVGYWTLVIAGCLAVQLRDLDSTVALTLALLVNIGILGCNAFKAMTGTALWTTAAFIIAINFWLAYRLAF